MQGQSIAIRLLTAFTLGGLLIAACRGDAADLPAVAPGISMEGERLSLQVERMPLSELLASIGRRSRVAIEVRGDLSGILVSASFENVELRRALRRLLSDHSYLLIEQETSAGVIEVILFGAPEEATPVPAASELHAEPGGDGAEAATPVAAEEARLEERPLEYLVDTALSSDSGEMRAAAVDAIAYAAASGEKATYADQVLLQSLSDSDEQVRAQALETLKDTADEIPVEQLARMILEDRSPELRIQALELLVERAGQGAHESLRTAFIDPEQAVQERVRELIEDWHIDLDGG